MDETSVWSAIRAYNDNQFYIQTTDLDTVRRAQAAGYHAFDYPGIDTGTKYVWVQKNRSHLFTETEANEAFAALGL